MGRTTLEGVVAHDGRLEVLSRVGTEPISAGQLTAQVEWPTAYVCYWLRTLEKFDLVQTVDPSADGETSRYTTDIDALPSLVQAEVTRHREEKLGIAGPLSL